MKIRIPVFFVLAATLLAACQSPASLGTPRKASLTIQIGNNINSRTLLPNIDMNPASYTVTGSGPNNATFTATTTGGTVTENNLAFGSWTVVVNATNAAGNLIGTGSASTQVNTASTSTVSVTVTPVSGVGTLNLAASWPTGSVQTPSVAATLTPALGSAQNLPFSISGSSASYSSSSVGNGYYTLALTVQDTGVVAAGAVDVVRIVTGATTSGTYAFSQVNAPGGTIQVNVAANMQNPLTVAIAGASATQAVGTSQTLTASVGNYTGNVVYVWYVNGVSAGTGPTFAFNSGSVVGYTYRIDVTAFSADGTQAGSATTSVGAVAATSLPSSFVNYTTTNGLGGNFVYDVAVSGSTIYAGTAGGLSKSSNGGISWTNYTPTAGFGSNQVPCVAVSGSTIYAGTAHGLWSSNTGGTTWTSYVNQLGAILVFSIAVSGQTIYAGTEYGLYISTDGGTSWTNYLGSYGIYGVAVSGSNIYAATSSGGLFVSADGGASWSNYTTANGLISNNVQAVSVSGSTICLAVLGALMMSADGGASWTTYSDQTIVGNVVGVVALGSTIYVATQGGEGLYVSRNGGASWTNYTTANGLGSDNLMNVSVSGSTIYAPTYGNGLSISQ